MMRALLAYRAEEQALEATSAPCANDKELGPLSLPDQGLGWRTFDHNALDDQIGQACLRELLVEQSLRVALEICEHGGNQGERGAAREGNRPDEHDRQRRPAQARLLGRKSKRLLAARRAIDPDDDPRHLSLPARRATTSP